jgi:gliding motility-associated-like protein
MTILFPVPLSVETGKDTVILSGTSAVVTARVTNGSGNYLYLWSPGSMVVNNTYAITETLPLTTGTHFLVRATDTSTGCFSEGSIHVDVEESIGDMLIITNGVTPNGDGNNDVWKIKGIEFFPDNEVVIFNRWGDRIKTLQQYDNVNVFWDGSNEHGKPVPDGTYFYTLTIRGRQNFKGWIQLKRSL